MGAWIEISMNRTRPKQIVVAPLVGAWIEIKAGIGQALDYVVAPLVGAWIEMTMASREWIEKQGRSSRGSVD